MPLIKKYLRPSLSLITLSLMMKLTSAITDLFLPRILAYMVDDVAPTKNQSNIIQCGLIMLLFAITSFFFNWKGNQTVSRIAQNTTLHIRKDLFAKITSLSLKQSDKITLSSLETRLTSDTYNIHYLIGNFFRMGVKTPITLIGSIILSLSMDVPLTLIMIGTLPFISLIVYTISKKGVPLYMKVQQCSDKITSKIRENVTGIRVIKAFGTQEYEKKSFQKNSSSLKNADVKASGLMAISKPSINFLLNLGTVFVILLGAIRIQDGQCKPGTILAFITYFTTLSNTIIFITNIFIQGTNAMASSRRIQEVLDLPKDLSVLPATLHTQSINSDYIVFDHVSFSYQGNSAQLKDLSFSLKKGETLGIIGATGSGKSTIIKLIQRLYDVTEGAIYINGQNIKTIPEETLHTMFGVVFQNDYLVNQSVKANISFGRSLSDDQIKKAAELSMANSFISNYTDQYDHEVSIKGSNLSGGQKQRLLIARSLANHPDILILDDSFSALDYKTDAALRKQLRLLKPKAIFLIAQRISSIRHADKILVLDHGCAVGYGTHEELLQTCSIYQEINQVQSKKAN